MESFKISELGSMQMYYFEVYAADNGAQTTRAERITENFPASYRSSCLWQCHVRLSLRRRRHDTPRQQNVVM